MKPGGLSVLIAGRAIQAVLSLAILKLLTNFLTPEDVANYYFVVAASVGFALVMLNPIGMWINRHIHEWKHKYSARTIFAKYLILHSSVAAIGVVVTIAFNRLLGLNENVSELALALGVGGSLLFQCLYQALTGIHNILGSKTSYSLGIAGGQILIFVAACSALLLRPTTLEVWFTCLYLGYALALSIFVYLLKSEITGRDSAKIGQLIQPAELISFCLPVIGVTLCAWVQTQGYRVMLSAMDRMETLALMAVGLGLAANIGTTAEAIVQQYLVPDFYKALADDMKRAKQVWLEQLAKVILFMGLACGGMSFFSHLILKVLTNDVYVAGAYFVRWGAWIEFFRILANFAYLNHIGEKKVVRALPAYAVGGAITLMAFALLPYWKSSTELIVLVGLLLGQLATLIALLWSARRDLALSILLKPLALVCLLVLPYAGGLWVPANSSSCYSLVAFALAGVYTLVVLRALVRKRLL